jgi:hypothetical protein
MARFFGEDFGDRFPNFQIFWGLFPCFEGINMGGKVFASPFFRDVNCR